MRKLVASIQSGVVQKIKSTCDADKEFYGIAIFQFLIHDFV